MATIRQHHGHIEVVSFEKAFDKLGQNLWKTFEYPKELKGALEGFKGLNQ